MSKSLLNAALCGALFAAGLTVQAAPREVTYLLPAPPNSPAFAPWVIAREKGYYADLGLKVTFVAGKGGVDVAKQIGAATHRSAAPSAIRRSWCAPTASR